MSMIKTRKGVKLFVKDWGEGKPVVMIHGWPLSSDSFDDLAMAVAKLLLAGRFLPSRSLPA